MAGSKKCFNCGKPGHFKKEYCIGNQKYSSWSPRERHEHSASQFKQQRSNLFMSWISKRKSLGYSIRYKFHRNGQPLNQDIRMASHREIARWPSPQAHSVFPHPSHSRECRPGSQQHSSGYFDPSYSLASCAYRNLEAFTTRMLGLVLGRSEYTPKGLFCLES